MAQFGFKRLAFVVAVLVAADISASTIPVSASDRALSMHLTVESGSGTAAPVEGSPATLRCDIRDYQAASHVVTWTRHDSDSASWVVLSAGGTVTKAGENRFLVSPVQPSNSSRRGEVHQLLLIRSLRASDQGLYRCNIDASGNTTAARCVTGQTIASRELALVVHPPDDFPVCSPSAAALEPLIPGDTLACGTLAEARVPVVSRRGRGAGEPEAWRKGPRRDGRRGWELTKAVNGTDDGVIYDCWAFPADLSGGQTAFSCPIAPRVMVQSTERPPAEGLSFGVIVGIVGGALAAFVLLVVVACFCCCKACCS